MITSIWPVMTLSLTLALSFCKGQPVEFIRENQFPVQELQVPNKIKQFVFEPKLQNLKGLEDISTKYPKVEELKNDLKEPLYQNEEDENIQPQTSTTEYLNLNKDTIENTQKIIREPTTPCPEDLINMLSGENQDSLNDKAENEETVVKEETNEGQYMTETTIDASQNNIEGSTVSSEDVEQLSKENEVTFTKNVIIENPQNPNELITQEIAEESTTPCLEKLAQDVPEGNKEPTKLQDKEEITSEVPEKLSDNYQNFLNKSTEMSSYGNDNKEMPTNATTKLPEKIAQKQAEQDGKELMEQVKEVRNGETSALEGVHTAEKVTEQLIKKNTMIEEDSTTPCVQENTNPSVESLLQVQKNSSLLKLLQQKHNRSKRQVPQYYTQKAYPNIRTYQQLQRQYQAFYPKGYVKPAVYRHRTKNSQNRRQGNVKSRSNTTIRSIRAAFKKKFRPSPVFP
ncbi:uncharacterized protein LOC126739454 [Anthonomus grandis grandis]|uniref:uncharacterized protein LOC126739454 n=1 Tax=Anthonomus grandis grandis TaxID=2921223 RepID=UPI002165F71C|nr:uncharacterized protein LOC126739454 [Anthonomus grandis grandis]